ncbi:MAG: metallophosphatase domain-containing protein [Dysgonomonas sp.]
MKILFLSDTHEAHSSLAVLPKADIIIHGGDISYCGKPEAIKDFLNWFSNLENYRYKIFIAGNHDFYFEGKQQHLIQQSLPENTFYLCDNGVTIEGIKIWGSPITPRFFNWAFNRSRGKEILKHWNRIPKDTNILVTHGPAYGILDCTKERIHAGCEDLLAVINKIKPQYHLSGHIHEGYGILKKDHTTFINGSVSNDRYEPVNQPILFEY